MNRECRGRSRPRSGSWEGSRGFTLFEIMMVLAILLIIVGVGLPAMITTVRKGPMRQAISDLEEGFLKARMLAILTGQPAEFVISASTGTLAVRTVSETRSDPAGAEPVPGPALEPLAGSGDGGGEERPRTEPLPTFSATLHESIAFRQLTISLRDMMDEEEAAVRFYPNGTSDALSALLFSETGEERSVALEITTGRPRIETLR
jgi:prepilin-type N-terminal cleavage/methylation domain-containing protein